MRFVLSLSRHSNSIQMNFEPGNKNKHTHFQDYRLILDFSNIEAFKYLGKTFVVDVLQKLTYSIWHPVQMGWFTSCYCSCRSRIG
jgi:hypothetical protein